MNINKNIYQAILCCVLISGIFACDHMESNYQEFLKSGEKIYPGKADSLQAHPGDYRIKLSWLLLADPTITRSKVYWNNKRDSLEVVVNRTEGIDTVSVMVENLEERSYSFEVFNFDADGNTSVRSEVLGNVYGDTYRSSILNRLIRDLSLVDDNLVIHWGEAEGQMLGEEISYTNNSGTINNIYASADRDSIVLEDFDFDAGFRFRSVFMPEAMAIDSFLTEYEDVEVKIGIVEKEVDKSLFSLYPLAGDYSEPNSSSSTAANIWLNENGIRDGNTYISKVNGSVMPQWFTIDLGAEHELSSMKLYQRGDEGGGTGRLYAGGNLMEFEVWGSLNPDQDHDPNQNDGDFGDSWGLLQHCTVNRPSGNTIASSAVRSDNTPGDIAAAANGYEFQLNHHTGKIRYVRIKALKNWDFSDRAFVNIAAIEFSSMQLTVSK